MADTVTNKLGLTKPEIGASNNTWGTKLNGNADILEAKVVRQSIQWTITTGDDNPVSTDGKFIITRLNNSQLRIDDPLVINRQTGLVSFSAGISVTGAITAPSIDTGTGTIKGGDITANRGATDGVYFFGTNNAGYIYYTSGTFQFAGGPISASSVSVSGNLSASSVVQAPYHRFNYAGNPGTPAGVGTFYVDGNGNPKYVHPNGVDQFLGVPPGTVAYTAGGGADPGWAICNGQWVSKAANPYLNARIGNIYGGDANNCALPDIRARVIAGVDDGVTGRLTNTLGAAGLSAAGGLDYHYLTDTQYPNHNHGWSGGVTINGTGSWLHGHTGSTSGATNVSSTGGGQFATGFASSQGLSINNTDLNHAHSGSVSGSIDARGGSSWHPNVQPTIILTAQIKLG